MPNRPAARDPFAVDVERLLVSVGGREQLAHRMAERFLHDAHGYLRDLDDALRSEDLPGVQLVAHRLKGALLMLRAASAGRLADELEQTAASARGGSIEELKIALCDEIRRVNEELLLLLEGGFSGVRAERLNPRSFHPFRRDLYP